MIGIEDLERVDLRVGTIVNVEAIPGKEKLYRVEVDLGELGVRQTVSAIAQFYKREELLGKGIVFVANLKPARIAGLTSEGMLLAAEEQGNLALVCLDREIANGTKVR